MARAGPDGCTFVEIHEVLSPASGQRFFDRGNVVEASPDDEGAFPMQFPARN